MARRCSNVQNKGFSWRRVAILHLEQSCMNPASNNHLELMQTPHARVWHVTCWPATAGTRPFVFSVLSFDFWLADISANILIAVPEKKK